MLVAGNRSVRASDRRRIALQQPPILVAYCRQPKEGSSRDTSLSDGETRREHYLLFDHSGARVCVVPRNILAFPILPLVHSALLLLAFLSTFRRRTRRRGIQFCERGRTPASTFVRSVRHGVQAS